MKESWRYILWVVLATVWVTVCFILPDFADNPVRDVRTVLTIGAYLTALGGACFWLIYLFGLQRHVAAVMIPLVGICGAAVSYFRVAFHATVTPMIIDATLHTNGGTIAGVVSWQLFVWIGVNVLITVAFLCWRFRLKDVPKAWIHALVVIVLGAVYYTANGRLQASINQRFPYNIAHSVAEYAQQRQSLKADRELMAYEAKCLPDSIDVLFVLGEAMRADHLQLNGYPYATTPLLAERKNVVSMPHIYSEQTYTSTSVPYILSPADSLHPQRSATHCSFIRVMNENGFSSAWISNQDNGRTYFSFIHEADTVIFPNAAKSTYVFEPWYDEQLLPPLDSMRQKGGARQLYVLHTIGSHWYYNNHVPPRYQLFQPTTTNRIITHNTDEQIIRAYDNTALYLDVFLDSLIRRYETRCALMIYLSDHGEALGEGGYYLHAGDENVLHEPACIVWYSDRYAAMYPEKIKALIANRDKRYRTDFLYYSILSAVGIETEGIDQTVDIFR